MKNNIPEFEYQLPERIKGITLSSGYYVKINRGYTATVRNLNDFVNYLTGTGDIDFDVFGIITNHDDEAEDSFVEHLYRIIAKIKGFAHFNPFKHQFVECDSENETISIKTKSGKRLTISVMERSECIDIKYFDSPMTPIENGPHSLEQFKVIGFNTGSTPVPHTDLTLLTILTSK